MVVGVESVFALKLAIQYEYIFSFLKKKRKEIYFISLFRMLICNRLFEKLNHQTMEYLILKAPGQSYSLEYLHMMLQKKKK